MDAQPEKTLTELIRFNNWANQQLLAACQGLSESELDTTMPGAYGSIRQTLRHIIRAETYYVRRLTGKPPDPPPFQWDAKPSVAEIKAYAAQVGEALVDVANRVGLTDRVDDDDNEGKPVQYHALAVFIQIVEHGIEHRTNITTILNTGLAPAPDLQGWGYLDAHPERFDYTVAVG
jgi:uncharacterized damage-inducible protein DinB